MGRRPLRVGETGKVTVKQDEKSGLYVARCRIRDRDGETRQLQAQAGNTSSAKRRLKQSVESRGIYSGTKLINSHMRLSELADFVFADLDNRVALKAFSAQTVRRYRQAWNVHIKPLMGGLALHEIEPVKCDDLLMTVRQATSPSNTKVVRATFNKIVSYADKGAQSALPFGNPMEKAEDIPGKRGQKKQVETLEPEEVRDLLSRLKGDPSAVSREIDLMVVWMVGTGDRIGNMVAADWSYLDLVEGYANLRGVGVELNGVMSIDFDSSKSHSREIDLPSQLVNALRALWLQREAPAQGFVFPGKRGNARGLRNLHKNMRQAFGRAGYADLKPHGFRRTTATELSRAGLSDHEIAAYLGHENVETTRRHYLKKRQQSLMRRTAIDDLLVDDDSQATVTALHDRSEPWIAQSAE